MLIIIVTHVHVHVVMQKCKHVNSRRNRLLFLPKFGTLLVDRVELLKIKFAFSETLMELYIARSKKVIGITYMYMYIFYL